MSYSADVTVLPSASRTASVAEQVLPVPTDCDTVTFIINATSINAVTPSVVFNVKVYDPVAGWLSVLASAAVTAVGTTVLTVGKNVNPVTNLAAQCVLGREVAISSTAGDADALTYSVTAKFA